MVDLRVLCSTEAGGRDLTVGILNTSAHGLRSVLPYLALRLVCMCMCVCVEGLYQPEHLGFVSFFLGAFGLHRITQCLLSVMHINSSRLLE